MSLLFDVWLVSGLTTGYLDGVLRDTGLNGDDFGLYSLLAGFGPATPTQIHRWTGWPTTTISAHLRRVDQRGHLDRRENPRDRRSSLVALSDIGLSALQAAAQPFLAAMHELRGRFAPDTLRQRLVLQDLDRILRDVGGLDARPYSIEPPIDQDDQATLAYSGPPLGAAQEQQVRHYIDFLRHTAGDEGKQA